MEMTNIVTTGNTNNKGRREMTGYKTEPPAKRMKNIVKATSLQRYVPLDAITAILARLPAKTLMKFRCVCKSWNFLIQQDYFVAAHLNTPSNLKKRGTICLLRGDESKREYTLTYSYGSKIHKIDFSLVPRVYFMTNSCDGLIGVYACHSFCIANPSIMKLAVLPRGSRHIMGMAHQGLGPEAAIGFEASTREYKVVRLFARELKDEEPVSIGCEVFYLGGKNRHSCWKLIDEPPVLAYMNTNYSPFVLNGFVYWAVLHKSMRSEIALSFSFREEKFNVVLHPEGNSRPYSSSITTLRGCLNIVDMLLTSMQMHIWTLEDDRNSKWVKQYNIHLSELPTPYDIFFYTLELLTMEDGRIVLSYERNQSDDWECYDPLTKCILSDEQITETEIYSYTGSIVWPWW